MPLPQENRYTYADFLAGTEEDREELIEGHIRMMSEPSKAHQEAVGEIYAQLRNYLRGKKCRAYIAPFDVRLFERDGDQPDDVDTVVEPDVMVVCDVSKVDDQGIKGAPDLIVEVLSPSTQSHDRVTKFNLYRRAGVREYWLVDPESRVVQSFILPNGQYVAAASSGSDRLGVRVLEGCVIDLGDVFPQE